MKKINIMLLACMLAGKVGMAQAPPTIINISTGTNAGVQLATGSNDPAWMVFAIPPYTGLCGAKVSTNVEVGGATLPSPGTTARWITGQPSLPAFTDANANLIIPTPYYQAQIEGDFTFKRTFSFSHTCTIKDANLILSEIGADNYVSEIDINGHPIQTWGTSGPGFSSPLTSATIPINPSYLINGTNEIEVIVHNSSYYMAFVMAGNIKVTYYDPNLVPTITGNTIFCSGSPLSLTGSGTSASQYQWTVVKCDGSGTPITGTGAYTWTSGLTNGVPGVFNFPDVNNMQCDQNYLVKLYVRNSCDSKGVTQQIFYACSPVPVISGQTNLCYSGSTPPSTQLCVGPSSMINSYNWSIGGVHGSYSSSQCITVSPSVNTHYNATITNNLTGCSGMTSVDVTVQNIQPVFTLNPSSVSNQSYFTMQVPAGSATYNSTDPSFGYIWDVREVAVGNPSSIIPNSIIANPPTPTACWNTLPNALSFPYYVGGTYYPNSTPTNFCSGVYGGNSTQGIFQKGHQYQVSFGTYSNTCPWASVSQQVYICSTCRAEDQFTLGALQHNLLSANLTSVESKESLPEVSIYPTPSTGIFTIEAASTNNQSLNIYDINGNLVLNRTISGSTTINGSHLPEGVYNVQISSVNGVVNKRIVIAR
jgi:hypothetical protein